MSSIGGGNGGGTGAVQVLDWKEAVETVATADIALTGEQTLNGLLTAASRVGVVAQADPTENGIYVSAAGPWTRSADADTDAKVTNGLAFAVGDSGSTKAGAIFILITPDPITLGVTGLVFSELTALPAHATTHENGGSDEINVDGLSGELADPQPASLATLTDLDSVGDLVFTKVGVPSATDDAGAGWVLGDHLYDVTSSPADGYATTKTTIGLAVWKKFTGDMAGKDTVATADIDDNAVTNAKAANMAADTIKGNDGALGDPKDLTAAEVRTLINVEDGATAPQYIFFADQLDNPNNANWAVNALAPVDTDSNNNALKVRRHDDTAEEGFGFILEVPDFATDVTFTFKSRAETASGAVRTVGLKVYERDIGDNAAVGAWSAGVVLTDIDIPVNENFQYDSQTLTLAAVGLVAGQTHQLEVTRIAPTGGTDLTGDWDLLSIGVKFS